MNTKTITKRIYDRTDLQLAVCEQLMGLSIEELADQYSQFTGAKLEVVDADAEMVGGDTIEIADKESFRLWFGFLDSVLVDRVEQMGTGE